MNSNIRLDTSVLKQYLTLYKETFQDHRLGKDHEIYKWKAVKCFQDNWDIDAPGFAEMLKNALSKTGNLLATGGFFPRNAILEMADYAPERVREMYRTLFNISEDLIARIEEFEINARELMQEYKPGKSSFQDPNVISIYLWLRFPDENYIYKYNVVKECAAKLAGMSMPSNKYDRVRFAFEFYESLNEEIVKDEQLLTMSKNSLGEDSYRDEKYRTLTLDVGYFISKNLIPVIEDDTNQFVEASIHPKNMILYGPPGTGKTYAAIQRAVAILENKPLVVVQNEPYPEVHGRFQQYRKEGLVAFTTFHQSFGYEEFIEGIRPVLADEEQGSGGDISYELKDGVFKAFC